MGEIVFVRHGQASFGTDDYDRLSPLGWQQARWLGQHMAEDGLRFDRAISGAQRRHRETASAMNEAMDLPAFDVSPGLNEFDYDTLEADALRAGVANSAELGSPSGFASQFAKILAGWEAGTFHTSHEPFTEFQGRVTDAVRSVATEGTSVLIVSSGGPKAQMMREVLGLDIDMTAKICLRILNASVTRFAVRGDRLELDAFNTTPHLSGPERASARTLI